MYRINLLALVLAFFAEIGVDILTQSVLFIFFGGDAISTDMSDEALQKVFDTVKEMPSYTFAAVLCGSATIVGGGYLAARIAQRYPYYHGLGMGLMGIAFVLFFWQAEPLWLNLLSLVSNIPLSIWGAHLAKRHMPPPAE